MKKKLVYLCLFLAGNCTMFFYLQSSFRPFTPRISAQKSTISQKPSKLFPIIQDERIGYIDNKGQIKISPEFSRGEDFSEGLASVAVGDTWGFINQKGKFVITPQFESLDADEVNPGHGPKFSEGLSLVSLNKKYGFIDKLGKFIIPAHFDYARNFSEGLACVGYKENSKELYGGYKVGYIDKTGKFVISPMFDLIYKDSPEADFHNGVAMAALKIKDGYDFGYLDQKGHFIWKRKVSTIQNADD